MGTEGPFSWTKALPGRDADRSSPSSAEVKNEEEVYLLSPLRLHRCVVGLLYLPCFGGTVSIISTTETSVSFYENTRSKIAKKQQSSWLTIETIIAFETP
jgi:hypothetical protein